MNLPSLSHCSSLVQHRLVNAFHKARIEMYILMIGNVSSKALF